MTDQPTLKQQAEDFAGELTQTVHAVVADSPPFKVDSVDGGSKFVIQQDSKTGIELTVDSKPLLSLLVNYRCTSGTWLRRQESRRRRFFNRQLRPSETNVNTTSYPQIRRNP